MIKNDILKKIRDNELPDKPIVKEPQFETNGPHKIRIINLQVNDSQTGATSSVLSAAAEKKPYKNRSGPPKELPPAPACYRDGDYGNYGRVRSNFPTSFVIFCMEQREMMKQQRPKGNIANSAKLAGCQWRYITGKHKLVYDEIAHRCRTDPIPNLSFKTFHGI